MADRERQIIPGYGTLIGERSLTQRSLPISLAGGATSIIFVANKVLSRQNMSFVATKVCRDKHIFFATNIFCRRNSREENELERVCGRTNLCENEFVGERVCGRTTLYVCVGIRICGRTNLWENEFVVCGRTSL